jgi:hypothetical protein
MKFLKKLFSLLETISQIRTAASLARAGNYKASKEIYK